MKIKSPNKDYTGVSASVPFCNGVGETEDPYLIQWFKDHGYEVEETPEKASKEAVTIDLGILHKRNLYIVKWYAKK